MKCRGALFFVIAIACSGNVLAESVLSAPDEKHQWSMRKHEGIPAIAVSPKCGRLWMTWYGGPTDCEDSNNYVILATSSDGGKSWRQVLVCDPDGAGPIRAFDPQVWVNPDGKLMWSWTERRVPVRDGDNYKNSCLNWFALSARFVHVVLDAEADPRPPYPEPRRIASGVMMCKPLVAADGAWLLPVSEWGDDISARIYRSADRGRSFDFFGGAKIPLDNREFDEHNVVQLRDDRLRLYMRVKNSKERGVWQSESSDGGRTWDAPQACSFAAPNSRCLVRRLRSGAILLVKNGPLDKDIGRKDLTAYVSDDDGSSWVGGLLLHNGDCSYPDGDQACDGTIYVVYDTERTGCRINSLARFTESDVRRGKIVSGNSQLEMKVDAR